MVTARTMTRISCLMVMLLSVSTYAQDSLGLFGNSTQPGSRLHQQIANTIEDGTDKASAIEARITDAISEDAAVLDGESRAVVNFDIEMANQFYDQMVEVNSLAEVIKVLTEENPDKAVQIITLGTVLYPDFAQEVFDGALVAGVMTSDEILVAVIDAGADPTTISDATAAGPTAAGNVAPLGAGVGAGGTGGGDTTASTN